MNRSESPKKQSVPFAVNGQRQDLLPTTPAGDNSASYNSGFPPVTMILKSAGGLPPKGQDMNQVLYELSALGRWSSAGGPALFDSDFATEISGYPRGAIVQGDDGVTQYLSTQDANTSNPNTGGAGWRNVSGGRLIGVRTITTSGTYTPTPGTKSIIVEVQGAGGGGGGVGTTNSTSVAVGCGGGGGAYAKSYLTNIQSSYAVTIGAGGAAGVNGNGGNGGGTSFGSIIANGGFGGGSGNGAPPIIQNASGIPMASGGNILNLSGENPTIGMALSTSVIISGGGGDSPLGVGGNPHGSAGIGVSPTGFGAGGGGSNAYVNNATQYNGAAGGNGVILVWEYA